VNSKTTFTTNLEKGSAFFGLKVGKKLLFEMKCHKESVQG